MGDRSPQQSGEEAAEGNTLSEISLRYRRNTIAICFILTILLVVPNIEVASLSVLGVKIKDQSSTAVVWVWTIILVLFLYQFIVFCIYAIPDARLWTATIKEKHRGVWYEMTDFWFLRMFRNLQDRKPFRRTITADGRIQYEPLMHAKTFHGQILSRFVVEKEKNAFKRMIYFELGFPLVWTIVLLVYIPFFDTAPRMALLPIIQTMFNAVSAYTCEILAC